IVIGRRKTIQLAEVTMIFDIWSPIVDQSLKALSKKVYLPESITCILAIDENITDLYYKLAKSTTKIETFREKIHQQFGALVSLLPEDLFIEFFNNFFVILKASLKDRFKVFLHYMVLTLDKDRKDLALSIIKRLNFLPNYLLGDLRKKQQVKFIDWLDEIGILVDIVDTIRPVMYENEFNLYLIQTVTQRGLYQKAIDWCFYCISSNSDSDYNYPYFDQIDLIFELAGDKNLELAARNRLLNIRTTYQDFNFLLNNYDTEKRNELINQFNEKKLHRSSQMYSELLKIKMKLLLLNGDHIAAIKKIEDDYSLYGSYGIWDELYKLDNQLLLAQILKVLIKELKYSYYHYTNGNRIYAIKKWLLDRYEPTELKVHIDNATFIHHFADLSSMVDQ
ncbi:MAG TPA: hypothetical protein PKD85_20400, partial [Saprospiraceae bacterium]|nr:hypothetical protein [Saprospiraceae bacterium]